MGLWARFDAGGNGCLPLVPGKTLVEGYEFEYQPASHESGGPHGRFTARSRGVQHIPGTFSLPDVEVDGTGIFVNHEGTRPFSFSPALALVNNISGCLKMDFSAHGEVSYPENLRGLLAIKGDYGTPCVPSFEATNLSITELWSNRFHSNFSDFTYTSVENTNGQFKGFHLEARPARYGKRAAKLSGGPKRNNSRYATESRRNKERSRRGV